MHLFSFPCAHIYLNASYIFPFPFQALFIIFTIYIIIKVEINCFKIKITILLSFPIIIKEILYSKIFYLSEYVVFMVNCRWNEILVICLVWEFAVVLSFEKRYILKNMFFNRICSFCHKLYGNLYIFSIMVMQIICFYNKFALITYSLYSHYSYLYFFSIRLYIKLLNRPDFKSNKNL